MPTLPIRVFDYENLVHSIAQKDNLGNKWSQNLYEALFLESQVLETVKFQESTNLDAYDSPYQELIAGLVKHHNYKSLEIIILMRTKP